MNTPLMTTSQKLFTRSNDLALTIGGTGGMMTTTWVVTG